MKFASALALGAFASFAHAATDGILCVNQNLIDVFDAINAVRATMTSAASYTALDANEAAYVDGSHAYWTTSDGTNEAILSGKTYITAAVAAVADLSAAIDDFTWAEGLADATT
jgi:uncharacterized protein (DUF2147 family)